MKPLPLVWLVAAALLLRLFILLSGTSMGVDVIMTCTTYDSNRYVVLADEMLAGHGFTRPVEEGPVHLAIEKIRQQNGTWPLDPHGRHPEGFRTPGYPLFLAAFGGRAGLMTALFAQCLLGAACATLAALVAFRLGLTPRSAFLVGTLWAFHPALLITDLLVLTESLFASVGLIAITIALHVRHPAGFLLAGFLIGLNGLIRPLGLLYLPALLILAPLPRRRWLALSLCLTAALLPSLLWALRNDAVGHGRRVSTVADVNLYYYGASFVLSESRGEDWKKSWPANIAALSERLKLEPGQDAFSAMRHEAISIYREHPAATLKVALKSQLKLMIDHSMEFAMAQYRESFESSGLLSDLLGGQFNPRKLTAPQLASLLWTLLNVAITLLAIIGLSIWLRHREWRLFLGCLITILLFSLATFPVGLERFRVPFMLYLFLPAARALAR